MFAACGQDTAPAPDGGGTGTVAETGTAETGTTDAGDDTPAEAPVVPSNFQQSPFLDGMDLPPVDERLPLVPKLTNELAPHQLDFQIGQFGGTLRTVTQAIEWDADVFVMSNEPLLNSPGLLGEEITGNVLSGFSSNADMTSFTFYLREGLRWSDGVPVTMEDFRFTIESLLFNTDHTTSVPNWLRTGGVPDGNPFQFEVVDDWTFKMTFDEPYGGFPIRMSVSGWVGYTPLLLPSHALKPFHIDYATPEEQALWPDLVTENSITEMGDLTWVNILNHHRVQNWDINQRRAVGFPTLNPWMLVEVTDTMRIFERNPFYFKVDAAGNQLPYIDRIESTTVQDMEMVQLLAISGEVDFMRESAALVNMPLYRSNEATGGFVTLMAPMHVTPTDIGINQTWAGGSESYLKMVRDVRFRRALNYAIDAALLADAVYFGFAEPNPWQVSPFDPDAGIALLEEMGMERGDDGWFRTPEGEEFDIWLEHDNAGPDMNPIGELVTEMWRDIGINASMRQLAGPLLGNRAAANELQARMAWTHMPLWAQNDPGHFMWGRLWDAWWNNTTEITITNEDGTTEVVPMTGEVPPDEVIEFYHLWAKMFQVSAEEASTTVLSEFRQSMNDNVWFFVPLYNVRQPVIVNNRLRNVTEEGFAIALNFAGEQLWFEQ
jgi:peptide/nickel transport system substrate-binding protein